jgi:hypothetical protein
VRWRHFGAANRQKLNQSNQKPEEPHLCRTDKRGCGGYVGETALITRATLLGMYDPARRGRLR